MTSFEHTIKILGMEIQREKLTEYSQGRITELKKAIKILTNGKGYLTTGTPKRIEFYRDL